MDALIEHIAENPAGYLAVGVCAIPLLWLFRKYTGPFIFHTCEVILYSAVFHVVFGGIVRFFAWFRDALSFENYDTSGAVIQTRLTTPMTVFWEKQLYVPESLYYVEVVAFLLIVFIVAWFRPMGSGRNRYLGKPNQPGSKGSARFDRNRRRMAYEGRMQARHR